MNKELARLNISLLETMLQQLNHAIGEGEYATPSDFIREALLHEFERRRFQNDREKVMTHLRGMIDEGLNSGLAVEISDLEAWKRARTRRLEERLP